jgi:hypothetical protein
MLWAISLPAAVIGWVALLLVTGAMSPSSVIAWVIAAVLLTLAVTMTVAPLVWVIAHRLRLPGAGASPAVALRTAAWIGLWVAVVVSLRLARAFDWVIVLTLAAVLGLAETFLQQMERMKGAGNKETGRQGDRDERGRS